MWEIVRNDIEQQVLRRAIIGNNGRSAATLQQRGRDACGQKIIGKVIANLSLADESLSRVGSSHDCHERASHLPWLGNNTLLEHGDIVLLYRVPIDYDHQAKTESLLGNANHMRWLFLNKAQGNRLPNKAYRNLGTAKTLVVAKEIPPHLQSLVRDRVGNSLPVKLPVAEGSISSTSTVDNGHSNLFSSSATNAVFAATQLSGTTEQQRLEALLQTSKTDRASDEVPSGKRIKYSSNDDEPEATFDSESFWTGSSTAPPQLYVCNRCGVPGHWLRDCPTKKDARFDGVKILSTNGIPKHYLKRVNVQDFDFDTTVTLYRDQEGHFFVKK